MCGFVAVFNFGGARPAVTEDLITRMRDTLWHRGPDGAGLFLSPDRRVGLGHRRLAILDIAGGAQPMFGPGGTSVVFNGEIYNYPRLRRELEASGAVFRTTCDTEVILHLYERHGDDCVRRLNGMFAFALWDPQRGRLLFARDRLGEKPLYWACRNGTFICGSEIKALLEHPTLTPAVNEDALGPYLANLATPSPSTLYRDVYKLPPGTVGSCDAKGVRLSRYWSVFERRRWADVTLEEASQEVRTRLDTSVHDRLMSDVPVGVLLSGGVDSTALLALLREQSAGLATFSVGYSDDAGIDERDEARRVAQEFGTDHHETALDEQEALEFLPALVHHQDEPIADPVCIPVYFVCRLAREHGVKVVLTGEGADEAFWGYPRYRRIMARRRWVRALLQLPEPLRHELPRLVRPERRPRLHQLLEDVGRGRLSPMHYPLGLTAWQVTRVLRADLPGASWAVPEADGALSSIDQLAFDTQEYEFAVRLPELLLMRIDRFSMATGVEARAPYLDPDLVSLAYGLPLPFKIHNGETKVALKRAVADIVPRRVLERPKQGFGAPIWRWFRSRMGGYLETLLESDALRQYFDVAAVRGMLVDHVGGRSRNEFLLWPVLNFALWHRYWIEGESIDEMALGPTVPSVLG